MKFILVGCIILFASFIVLFIQQGKLSQTGSVPGLTDGKLAACPNTPNCICSEFPDDNAHYSSPLHLANLNAEDALTRSAEIITAMGGSITQTTDNYLAATFTSSLFHFVDDFEIRRDTKAGTLHMRSASRVGYSDLGMNKKRISLFIEYWENKTPVTDIHN